MTPSDYCYNKLIRINSTSRYNPITGCQYLHEGVWHKEEDFKKMFPIDSMSIKVIDNYKGLNSDRTKVWMED